MLNSVREVRVPLGLMTSEVSRSVRGLPVQHTYSVDQDLRIPPTSGRHTRLPNISLIIGPDIIFPRHAGSSLLDLVRTDVFSLGNGLQPMDDVEGVTFLESI